MKQLTLTIALVLSFLGFNANGQTDKKQLIGISNNGEITITASLAVLKSLWDEEFTMFDIKSGVDSGTLESYYFLLGSTLNQKIKGGALLVLKNNQFYLANHEIAGIAEKHRVSVICKGCREGCFPDRKNNQWLCTEPSPKDAECEKAVTVKY